MVTGTLVANHDAGVNKTDPQTRRRSSTRWSSPVSSATTPDSVDAALADAVLLAESTLRVQRWVSAPSNTLTPTRFAAEVSELCADTSLTRRGHGPRPRSRRPAPARCSASRAAATSRR